MKPFDLARAQAGEPLVTRDGRKAKFIACVEGGNSGHQVAILVAGVIEGYWSDGRYMDDAETSFDLFMAPKKRTVYVNLYRYQSPRTPGEGYFYTEDTEQKARDGALIGIGSTVAPDVIAVAIPIEIEE